MLTKKEKRQITLTRNTVIAQLSNTGRKGSAQNIRKEKTCLSSMEKKREKNTKTKIPHPWRGNQVSKNKHMNKIKFTYPVSQVSKSEWFSVEDIKTQRQQTRP